MICLNSGPCVSEYNIWWILLAYLVIRAVADISLIVGV